MDYTQILRKPLITEKTTALKEDDNQLVFFVQYSANKIEIKKAIEEAFQVSVKRVNTANKKPQLKKRFGRTLGKEPGYKKAYITLEPGEKISYFEGV
ncbi:MAG: 50S ribosomal protein L23 [Desulfohalobiaceae bacterium]|nr:50S ribosomal protein L23 [Desulfohalobiaceae bacterium]